ncbi:MAG: glycosyl hydrolase, partial [Bacteroidia bacterium]
SKQGVLWAGSDDGYVNVSQDNGKTWTNVTPKELPGYALISYVVPSNYEPAVCYVSATRYKLDDQKPYLFKTEDYGKTWKLITTGLPQSTYTRCISEDPNKKGLLYCGTETGIYVSFNDGGLWQPMQLNLPHTPVHDIKVQKRDKDLCIATHGRAFWILDDITPLYQLSDSIANAKAWLYKPRDSYRTPGAQAEDPLNDPTIQQGQNAPNGVIVYYYFKNKPKKEVRLAFYTDKSDSIITYSNLKNTKNEPIKIHKEYYLDKAAKRPGILTADSLMNYFVWDMHYPDAKIDTSAIIGGLDNTAPTGPEAVPGTYKVKLLVGDSVVMQQSFNIVEDPRLHFTSADLQEQFTLSMKIHAKLNEVGKATKKIRSITGQINDFLASFTDSVAAKPYKTAAKSIIDSLAALENTLHNSKIKAGEDALRYPFKLEEKLSAINSVVQAADGMPTESEVAVYNDLSQKIDIQLARLKTIIDQKVVPFNQMATGKKKDVIDLSDKATE